MPITSAGISNTNKLFMSASFASLKWPNSSPPSVLTSFIALPLVVVGTLLVAVACLDLDVATSLYFVRSEVTNIANREFFTKADPPGFIAQNANSSRLRVFRSLMTGATTHDSLDLATVIKIRHWVHEQQPTGDSWIPHRSTLLERFNGDIDDPILLLNSVRRGAPATCRNFSILMVGAIESIGMKARLVMVADSYWKNYSGNHSIVEVWIPSLSKWVLMDAMGDSMFTLDAVPASAMDVYDSARKGVLEKVELIGRRSASI